MAPIRFILTAVQIFLSLGLVCGYGTVIRDMATAAAHAHTHKPLSAAKFNRLLWHKELAKSRPSKPSRGENK